MTGPSSRQQPHAVAPRLVVITISTALLAASLKIHKGHMHNDEGEEFELQDQKNKGHVSREAVEPSLADHQGEAPS